MDDSVFTNFIHQALYDFTKAFQYWHLSLELLSFEYVRKKLAKKTITFHNMGKLWWNG